MEPFFDGGLIELFIVMAIGYSLNFVFRRKYLLMVYSFFSIVAPIGLVFTKKSELFIWLVSVCIFNGIFLVTLLWKRWLSKPNEALFDTQTFIKKFLKKKTQPSIEHSG